MKDATDIICEAFNVTSKGYDCGTQVLSGRITEAMIEQVIADGKHDIAWQDNDQHDCGLNDGLLYIMVGAKANTSLIGAFVAIDNSDGDTSVCYTT